jgi:hypothetical protein
MKRVTINIGFITNSSSVVYWIPRQVLEDAQVAAFISKYELQDGYIGDELWSRGSCGSFAVTREQRERINRELTDTEYRNSKEPVFNVDEDNVVAVYGDEYSDISMELAHLLRNAAERMGLPVGRIDYN